MASKAHFAISAKRAKRWGPVVLAALVVSGRAHGEETPLVVIGGAFDASNVTVAPIAFVRIPLPRARTLTFSQAGWTSAANYEAPENKTTSLVSSLSFTPLRAHLSRTIYDEEGRELVEREFSATRLRLTAGTALRAGRVRLVVQGLVAKEWLGGLSKPEEHAFLTPILGTEFLFSVESIRHESPLEPRIDGVRFTARTAALFGPKAWLDGEIALSLGRRFDRAFLRLEANAFGVGLDHPATRILVGGSWDVLQGLALFGHPLGAFRLTRGAAITASADLRVFGRLEIGLRGSVLAGADRIHDGLGVMVHGTASGVHYFVGAATADGAIFRGDFRGSLVCGLNGALLFLP